MTAPDIPTLIACATLLVLALLTPFLNAFLRKPKASAAIAEDSDADEAGAPSGQLPQFSIVLSVHDQAQELERNLPRLLSQQYPHYEVIVVDESSTDGTADTLKRLKAQYPTSLNHLTKAASRRPNTRGLSLPTPTAPHWATSGSPHSPATAPTATLSADIPATPPTRPTTGSSGGCCTTSIC